MPMLQEAFATADDYWNLPEGRRAELVDGVLYDMAPPSVAHQKVAGGLFRLLANHIEEIGGTCLALQAPVAVDLEANEGTWVEPDVLVVCDPAKVTDRAIVGAPDFVAEVVSPSSMRMDYYKKLELYERAGVREYWIVDLAHRRTTVYRFTRDGIPVVYPFGVPVPVGVWDDGLLVEVGDLV